MVLELPVDLSLSSLLVERTRAMDVPSMVVSDLCATEETVLVLLDHLVDPLLPGRSLVLDTPSESLQQLVAKQVHAVVLLYNYYHIKQHQQLKFKGFESFSKLAVVLKPSLLGHLKLMQKSNVSSLDDPGEQLSLTEKAIMDACDISKKLDASKEVPRTEGWPISKVAVLLIDSQKEICYLQNGSITRGVWSLIEKDVDFSSCISEGVTKRNHNRKMIKVVRNSSGDGMDEISYQQVAFQAVMEAAGIDQRNLIIIERNIAYSLSKEKTMARFYMMHCKEPPKDDNVIEVPIKDAIDSLHGPLVMRCSGEWIATKVVDHFHLLPYARLISDWLSREVLSSNSSDTKRTEEPNRPENSDKPNGSYLEGYIEKYTGCIENTITKSAKNRCSSDGLSEVKEEISKCSRNQRSNLGHINVSNCKAAEKLNNQDQCHVKSNISKRNSSDTNTESQMPTEKRECLRNGVSDDFDGPCSVNVHAPLNEEGCKSITDLSGDSDTNGELQMPTNQRGCPKNDLSGDSDGPWCGNVDAPLNEEGCRGINGLSGDSNTNSESQMPTDKRECPINGLSCDSNGLCSMNVDAPPKEEGCKSINAIQVDDHQNMIASDLKGDLNGTAVRIVQVDDHQNMIASDLKGDLNGAAVRIIQVEKTGSMRMSCSTECRSETAPNLKATGSTNCSDEYEKPIGDCAKFTSRSNSKDTNRLQNCVASVGKNSQIALGVLLSRRNKLTLQQRNIEDKIAVCDKKIHTILNSGEDEPGLNLESFEEYSDNISEGSLTHKRTCQQFEFRSSPKLLKMKRLSEAVLVKQNSCQELDGICYENNWMLPTYHVSHSNGKFNAQITVRGIDFECSNAGDPCSNPHEARESVATQVLAKLRIMASHPQ